MAFVYPEAAADRDRWILAHRPARAALSEQEPYGYFIEEECGADGQVEQVATILLTNRECSFHCAMCDLWRNTLTETVSTGAIPAQIEHALQRLSRRARSNSTTAEVSLIRVRYPRRTTQPSRRNCANMTA